MRGSARPFGVLVLVLGLVGGARAGSITVDYTTLGPMNAPSISVGGTTVTGSSNVTADQNPSLGSTGLGIAGGGDNASLDLGETMTINYGQLVTNVTLTVYDISPPGNVDYQFEAFNGTTSLGTFTIPPHKTEREIKDLTSLDGGLAFTSITLSLTASAPKGLIIEGTSFDYAGGTVPEPASWLLLASGALPLIGVARRRRAGSA